MYKINFKISLNTYSNINRYAAYLNLKTPTIIRFLLTEQINHFVCNPSDFQSHYKNCKPKDTLGTIDSYGKEKPPKEYSMEISEHIYRNIQNICKEYNDTTNTIVNNLLHMGIREKFKYSEKDFFTPYNDLAPNTKQYSIPLSDEFTQRLNDISEITGIKTNQLISLIIGNYLFEHFTDYDNDIYMTLDGRFHHHGVW